MTERPRSEERSLGELLKDLAAGTQTLLSKEIELAKLEVREGLRGAQQGAALGAGAALLGLVGLIMLALAAAYGLAELLPLWAAMLIVAGVLLVGAAALGLMAKRRFASANPRPAQTLETLKEDGQWLKRQIS
jgi:uncharacterized membrane protein YqjE